jgi:aspartyl-tRNA(Asn)/glutamyl-tRNA(Gln) amidotransferase subunit B
MSLARGWQVVIGIETHAQIKSRQKLFSSTPSALLSDPPNSRVNAFDAAFPGTLPKVNSKCILLALRAAIALNCTVNKRSSFDRKHYFYPDSPAGYQITQNYSPFASNGVLQLASGSRRVRIKQIQLEQDTAKTTSDIHSQTSRIDLNRAGTGLLEIVSEPDITSSAEAVDYVRTLQSILYALGVSDGNMETVSNSHSIKICL